MDIKQARGEIIKGMGVIHVFTLVYKISNFEILNSVLCGVRDKIKEWHLSLSSMDVVKGD
jgi:hypothetical protein